MSNAEHFRMSFAIIYTQLQTLRGVTRCYLVILSVLQGTRCFNYIVQLFLIITCKTELLLIELLIDQKIAH